MKNPYKRYSKINPQRETGNRQICNEVFRALISGSFTGAEYKLILALIDHTWGWGKTSDTISISKLAQATNLSERTVQRTLKKLKQKRVTYLSPSHIRVSTGSPLNEYMLNKHYDTWIVKGCQPGRPYSFFDGAKGDLSVTHKGDLSVTQLKKYTLKENKEKRYDVSSSEDTFVGSAPEPTQKTPQPPRNPKPKLPKTNNYPIDEIVFLYNKILGNKLPSVKLTESGKPVSASLCKHIGARCKERAVFREVEFWRTLFVDIRDNMPFLTGQNKNSWKASLFWIVGPENIGKILSGNYYQYGPDTGSSLTDGNLRAVQSFIEKMEAKGDLE